MVALAQAALGVLLLVSPEGALDLRVEARGGALSAPDLDPRVRVAAALEPRAALALRGDNLRLGAEYAPRFWSSDLGEETSPLATHTLTLRLEAAPSSRWRTSASASASLGQTDPLADPLADAGLPEQQARPEPVPFRAAGAAAHVGMDLGPRTTASAGASVSTARGTGPEGRTLLPPQEFGGAEAGLRRAASERTHLEGALAARLARTERPDGRARSAFATATGRVRRRLSPTLDGWAGAGAALVLEDEPAARTRRAAFPLAEAGVIRAGSGAHQLALEVSGRVTPFLDRFTGAVETYLEGTASAALRPAAPLTLRGGFAGGRRTDGAAAHGALDLRLSWSMADRAALEFAAVARWQHDHRAEIPSFVDSAALAAFSYGFTYP